MDVRNTSSACVDTMVYITDVLGFGLLVYNNQQNNAWRFVNKLMYANPDYGTLTIDGDTFVMMEGILGLALTPKGNRTYYLFN